MKSAVLYYWSCRDAVLCVEARPPLARNLIRRGRKRRMKHPCGLAALGWAKAAVLTIWCRRHNHAGREIYPTYLPTLPASNPFFIPRHRVSEVKPNHQGSWTLGCIRALEKTKRPALRQILPETESLGARVGDSGLDSSFRCLTTSSTHQR